MKDQSVKLPRRLFGYHPISVEKLLADRDAMLQVAESRIRVAEAQAAGLEEQLRRRDEDVAALKAQLEVVTKGEDELEAAAKEDEEEEEEPPLHSEVGWAMRALLGLTSDAAETSTETEGPEAADRGESFDLETEEPAMTAEPTDAEMEDAAMEPEEPDGPETGEATAPETEEPDAMGLVEATAPETGEPDAPEPVGATSSEEYETVESRWDAIPWGLAPSETPEASAHEPTEPAEPEAQAASLESEAPEAMSDELAKVVKQAEESASGIIEQAWESTRERISEIDRLWGEVQAEIARFAAWRHHVEPKISQVLSYIREARARIEEVPDRVQDALTPAVEAMTLVDSSMTEFAEASSLTILLGKLGLRPVAEPGDEASGAEDGVSSSTGHEEATSADWDLPSDDPDEDVTAGTGHSATGEVDGGPSAQAGNMTASVADADYSDDVAAATGIADEVGSNGHQESVGADEGWYPPTGPPYSA